MPRPKLEVAPYFDDLLTRLEAGDRAAQAAFGRHVHWGYWPEPELADGTAEDYGRAAERLCRLVCDAAGICDGLRVLDVGCGIGGTIASLNERYSNLDLVGVNIDARQLRRAEETIRPANGNRIRFVEADACKLPFGPGSFDAVLAVECIFHFPSRQAFLEGAARTLVPGGKLAISDFVPSTELEAMARGKADLGRDEATRASYGQIDLRCSLAEYRRLGGMVSLEVSACEDISAGTMPTYSYLRADQKAASDRETARTHERATNRIEMACRMGLVRYSIVSFERRAEGSRLAA